MSKNIAQIFATTPITTIGNTDLFYVGQGGTTDAAIDGASFNALFPSSALPSAHIYVGNAGNIATSVLVSGDGTLSNTGVLNVTSTGGVPFAASATVDTTDASNITSGILGVTEGGLGIGTIPADGQIPIGNGANYVAASVTAGAGITITPGAG